MYAVLLPSLLSVLTLQISLHCVSGGAVQVTARNYEDYKVTEDIMLLNFYADWCRFSQQLKPIFEKAAEAMAAENTEGASVMFGKVDCEAEKSLCANPFHVSKYPTMKMVRYGEVARKEYRGKRAVDAIVQYVKDQMKDPVQVLDNYYDLTKKEDVKRAVVGFFSGNDSLEYSTYKKAAINLRDDCPFYAVLQQAQSQLIFREESQQDISYRGDLTNLYSTSSWITDKCIPLVREITFQNGEEMTEQGIPLLILFYHPDRTEVKELFKSQVAEELKSHRGSITAVTADGLLFAHPLHHLGKTKNDLPVMAIDSFRHMYVFPNFEDIKIPGRLKTFVDDLHSGKLHREFHHGPDAATAVTQEEQRDSRSAPDNNPPESTFRKLRPDGSRYTMLRDEL